MDDLGSGEQVLPVLRAQVLRPGAVFEGFRGVDVVDDTGTGLTVLFHWRADPMTYAVTVPVDATASGAVAPVSASTGLAVESLQEWVQDVTGWLGEEVGTGLVRRARRTLRGGVVHLDLADSADVMPAGYFVGHVHLGPGGDGGRHLSRAGFHVRAAQEALGQGRLLTWLDAYVDNARGAPVVGHAALTWDTPTATPGPGRDGGVDPAGAPGHRAQLEVLEVARGRPATVAAALAFHGLRDAAEAGVRQAVTTVDAAVVAEIGFSAPGADGWRTLALSELPRPDMHH